MDQITEILKLATARSSSVCSLKLRTLLHPYCNYMASVSFTAAMKASGAEGILIWVLGYQNVSIIPSAQHLVLVLHRKSTYRL